MNVRLAVAAGFALWLSFSTTPAQAADLADTVAADKDLATLHSWIVAAGLEEKLKESGPFTLFAPTEDAFKKVPTNTKERLLKPENKEQLVKVLTYHLVPQKLTSHDIVGKMFKVKTANGREILLDADEANEPIRVNNDNNPVTKTDIAADNGVIHYITRVMFP